MASFTWVSKKTNDELATLSDKNITLNKSASTYFETAYSVLLGISEEVIERFEYLCEMPMNEYYGGDFTDVLICHYLISI